MASARTVLVGYSSKLPGSRLLEERYGAQLLAMAVPKPQAGWLAYVSEFVEETKASGLVQRIIERAASGLRVAPLANRKSETRRMGYIQICPGLISQALVRWFQDRR
jgi:polar amino acid transport system substrate-binding protein